MKKLMMLLLLASGFIVFIACGETTTQTTILDTTTETTTEQDTTEVTLVTTQPVTTTEITTTEQVTTTETTTQIVEPVDLSISSSKPYIFVNVNEPVNLIDYMYRSVDGEMTLADVTIDNISDGLSITTETITTSMEGTYSFDITYGEETFMIHVFSKLEEATDYLVYAMDFSDMPDGDIPSDYSIETIGLGSTGIKDGYLFVDSPDIGDPTRVLLPDFLKGFKNYIIEVDFSILTAVEESRWGSLMYRFSPANYFQMCIRQEATATNGVEFAKSVNGQWNVPVTVGYTENIDSSSIYRLKVDLNGSDVKEYINDELLIDYGNARDYSNGHIGVQASGARTIFNDFEIRIPESYIDYTTIEYQGVPTVYTPETNMMMAPTVVQVIETQDDIDQLAEEIRGATALFDINPALEAINDDSEVLLSFIDILEATKGDTIPAFRTRLPFVAHSLAIKLEELGVRDVVVVSSNASVIERARDNYNMIRGVYEILYDDEKPELSDADLLEIRNTTNSSGAIAVILPIEYATKYNVDYLQRRLITVWVDSSGQADPLVIQGIVSGANGLVTDDSLNVYGLFDTFPENALMRMPLIIGHRGMPSVGPENTVEGSALALEAGADIVEMDIYLTTDNEIVVMHDTSTERTTDGNLVVENSTLAELRALTIIDNFGTFQDIPVPTLEEYFQEFKGTGLLLFIEIKSTNANMVPVLKELIEEYDFYDQACVITFHVAQATLMREHLPEISVGLLNGGLLNTDNVNSSITASLNQIVPLKTTLNPYYGPVTQEILLKMQHRGITMWPWTTNNPDIFLEQLTSGMGGITTDFSTWITDEFVNFSVAESEYVYSISNPTSIELMGRFGTPGGFDYPFPATLEILSGSETGITFGTKNLVQGITETGDVYILPSFETTLSNGATITLYSNVIHIEIVE